MDHVELLRRLENLIRFGTIHSVDHAEKRCRVQTGHLVTQWLRWMERRAGETTTWDPPTIGEQCVVFSPSGELGNGMVFFGAPSDVIDTPSHSPDQHVTRYPDGTVVSYDHAAGLHKSSYPDGASISYHHPSSHLEAVGIVTGLVRAAESITFDTPITHITGQCIVDGLLTYNNGLSGYPGTNGSKVRGNLRHENGQHEQTNVEQIGTGGKIVSNGITLDHHGHINVQNGPGTSGDPV